MALPEKFLRKTPEQQKAALRRGLKAYHEAEPGQEKARGREALMSEEPEPAPQK